MKKAVTGRSTLFPQVQRGAGRCKAPPGEAEGGPRASAHNRAEPSVSAGVLPALWAMECGRGASEFRGYRGEIRPEAERLQGFFIIWALQSLCRPKIAERRSASGHTAI